MKQRQRKRRLMFGPVRAGFYHPKPWERYVMFLHPSALPDLQKLDLAHYLDALAFKHLTGLSVGVVSRLPP